MIEALEVTTQRGDSLKMELANPEKSGLLISDIEGITTGDAAINVTDYGVLDGGVFNSARIGTRNITISFYYLFKPDIETSRHTAYFYFPVKEYVDLKFITDHRTLVTRGYVESNDTDIFSKQELGQVSVVCPDPFFYDEVVRHSYVKSIGSEFEFPFSNESLDKPLICFGDYIERMENTIEYEGDISTGFICRIRFDDTDITDLKFIDVTRNVLFDFDLANMLKTYDLTIEHDDQIVFSTIKGNRYIVYRRGQSDTNLLSFYYSKMVWFQLHPGTNMYYIDSGDANLQALELDFEYKTVYGGV